MKNKKIIAMWTRVLVSVLEGKTASAQKKILERVEEVLKQKKKEYLLPKILGEVSQTFRKRSQLELTFARAQEGEVVETINKKLAAVLGQGKEIVVLRDPEIIGGFVAKTEDHLINASIANYLEQLKRQYAA